MLVLGEQGLFLAATDQALRHAWVSGVVLNVQQLPPVLRGLSPELPLSRLLLHLALALRCQHLVLLRRVRDGAQDESLRLVAEVHGVLGLVCVQHDRIVCRHRSLEGVVSALVVRLGRYYLPSDPFVLRKMSTLGEIAITWSPDSLMGRATMLLLVVLGIRMEDMRHVLAWATLRHHFVRHLLVERLARTVLVVLPID